MTDPDTMAQIGTGHPAVGFDVDIVPQDRFLEDNTLFNEAVTTDYAIGQADITFNTRVVAEYDHTI